MTRDEFKAAARGAYRCFRGASKVIDALEAVGLIVEPWTEKPGVQGLYGIQDAAGTALMEILGTKDAELLSIVDCIFMADGGEDLSEESFGKLLDAFRERGIAIPWEEPDKKWYREENPVLKHRAVSLDGKPVKGYAWMGASHIYVIPDNAGVAYDEKTSMLTARAVEVRKDSIGAETGILDDNLAMVFYGEDVQRGSKVLKVRPMDPETVQFLTTGRGGADALKKVQDPQ